MVQLGDKGADFFGFSHPTIQNLIQSLSGARKCTRYKWVKYEVNREGLYYVEEDPAVNYDCLLRIRSDGGEWGRASGPVNDLGRRDSEVNG
jgi:hypothetical protein